MDSVEEWAIKFFKSMKLLTTLEVVIGYFGDKGSALHPESNVSVATIAAMQEFGTIEIKERSFLRSTLNEKGREITGMYEKACAAVATGSDAINEYTILAIAVHGMVIAKLDSAAQWAEPLLDKTIIAKGTSTPLYDSGTLRENLGWAILQNGVVIRQG